MGTPDQTVWTRLIVLEKCCDVSLESLRARDDGQWVLTVEHRSRPKETPIVVRDSDPLLALTRGVDAAETRGWHELHVKGR